jgi:hypothetical protein
MINKKFSSAFITALLALGTWACTTRYYSIEDFASVRKVDTHVHVYTKDPAAIEQAREDNFILVNVNVDVPSLMRIDRQYDYALHLARSAPKTMYFLSTFTMEGWSAPTWEEDVIDYLQKSFREGALGIKIWKNIGLVEKDSLGNFIMIDHPSFDPIMRFIIEQDKTVLGHFSEPRNCWLPLEEMTVHSDRQYFARHPEYHAYLHPEIPDYEAQINARDQMLERYPNLRFVGAHLGSLEWSVDELAKRLDRYPNMAVDLAERICHLQYQSLTEYEKVRDFILKYQDRLIYGTDVIVTPDSDSEAIKKHIHELWLADWKYFTSGEMMTTPQLDKPFRGLQLPAEVIDKIYYRNAVRWFKIPVE